MTNNNLILKAKLLGTKAFKEGKKAIPYLDSNLNKLLEDNRSIIDFKNILPILKAWTSSWHLSNLNNH